MQHSNISVGPSDACCVSHGYPTLPPDRNVDVGVSAGWDRQRTFVCQLDVGKTDPKRRRLPACPTSPVVSGLIGLYNMQTSPCAGRGDGGE